MVKRVKEGVVDSGEASTRVKHFQFSKNGFLCWLITLEMTGRQRERVLLEKAKHSAELLSSTRHQWN